MFLLSLLSNVVLLLTLKLYTDVPLVSLSNVVLLLTLKLYTDVPLVSFK